MTSLKLRVWVPSTPHPLPDLVTNTSRYQVHRGVRTNIASGVLHMTIRGRNGLVASSAAPSAASATAAVTTTAATATISAPTAASVASTTAAAAAAATAAIATTTTTAASVASATTAAAASTAASATTAGSRPGLVHNDVATADLLAVHISDGALELLRLNVDEREAAAFNDSDIGGLIGRKGLEQALLGGGI